MGIPILTSEGFLGQRWIIDDYFKVGEMLLAGDVVVVKERSTTSALPRVFKATSSHEKRVIGIVHTPASKVVGEQMATTGATEDADEYVPVVVKGIAKTLSGGAIGVGDPVMASGSSATPTAPASTPAVTLGAVATVVDASTHSHSPDSDGMTGDHGAQPHGERDCPGSPGAAGRAGRAGACRALPDRGGRRGREGRRATRVTQDARAPRARAAAAGVAAPPTATTTTSRPGRRRKEVNNEPD